MHRRILPLAVFALAAGAALARPAPAVPPDRVLVLAASSLTDVLPKVATAWTSHGNHAVNLNFDATSRLVEQIEAGAPADVFVAADLDAMDDLAEAHRVDDATTVELLGNTLVAVVPRTTSLTVTSPAELTQPGVRRLAIAGPQVPAGKYARRALDHLALAPLLAARFVIGDTVRSALGAVARGEADAGVVYATDARVEPGVKVAFVFPDDSYPPIVYPAAVVADAPHAQDAAAFLTFCQGAEASAIFAEAGFKLHPN